MPDQTPHGASQWQAWCLPNLEDTFRRPKGLDLWKKTKWNISFWNNKSWWNRQTKNSNKNVLKTYFLFGEVCYDAAINWRAFSHQYTKMRRRMATKEEVLSEFWMLFHAKNDQRKYSKFSNQTYLRTSKSIHSLPTINQNVFLVQDKGMRKEGKEMKVFQWVVG